jgi:hypothetical protein
MSGPHLARERLTPIRISVNGDQTRNMLWLTAIHGVGLPAIGVEPHASMVHRPPTSAGNMLELISLATLLIRRWRAERVEHARRCTCHAARSASRRRCRRGTDFGRGGEVIASSCNSDSCDTVMELGAFKAINPIGSACAECAGTDHRRRASSDEREATIELGLLGGRRARVSASNSRSRPQGAEPGRRSDQVSSVSSWATTRRNPASNSVISNKSRWF